MFSIQVHISIKKYRSVLQSYRRYTDMKGQTALGYSASGKLLVSVLSDCLALKGAYLQDVYTSARREKITESLQIHAEFHHVNDKF